MLLDELDRLNGAEAELKSFTGKFYETSTLLAVCKRKAEDT